MGIGALLVTGGTASALWTTRQASRSRVRPVTQCPDVDLRSFKELAEFLDDREERDPRSFIGAKGSASLLAAVMKLLAPPTVEYRGAVLLAFSFDRAPVDAWFLRLDGDVAKVERVVNHMHVWDILPTNDFDEDEAVRLVEPVAWFWRSALKSAYPDRRFVVDVERDADYGPELTFYTVAPA